MTSSDTHPGTKIPSNLPKVEVRLSQIDGNAFLILGKARTAMNRANYPAPVIEAFLLEARSGDYDHLLQTVMTWCETS